MKWLWPSSATKLNDPGRSKCWRCRCHSWWNVCSRWLDVWDRQGQGQEGAGKTVGERALGFSDHLVAQVKLTLSWKLKYVWIIIDFDQLESAKMWKNNGFVWMFAKISHFGVDYDFNLFLSFQSTTESFSTPFLMSLNVKLTTLSSKTRNTYFPFFSKIISFHMIRASQILHISLYLQ